MRRLWLLLTIPLILGCIGGGDEEIEFAGCIPAVADGLAITGFEPDLAEIYSGENVLLTLDMQNLGGSKATGIEAEIMNHGALGLGGESVVQTVTDMDAPEEGMPDITEQANWNMLASSLDVAGTETSTPAATLSYTYSSVGTALIKFIPESDWRKMRQDGETVTTIQTCSDGPIAVSVAPLRAPITENTGEFTTRIVMKNIGGGKVKTGAMDKLGDIKITLPDADAFEEGSMCDFTPITDNVGTITGKSLNRNGELTLTCKLLLDKASVQTIREAEYEVKVEVEYGYLIDTTTSVSVTQQAETLTTKLVSPLGAVTWYADKDLEVEIDPRRSGESICEESDIEFSATIKNDMVNAQDVGTITTYTNGCDDALKLVIARGTFDNKLYNGESTLTLSIGYRGKKASLTIDDITVSEADAPTLVLEGYTGTLTDVAPLDGNWDVGEVYTITFTPKYGSTPEAVDTPESEYRVEQTTGTTTTTITPTFDQNSGTKLVTFTPDHPVTAGDYTYEVTLNHEGLIESDTTAAITVE